MLFLHFIIFSQYSVYSWLIQVINKNCSTCQDTITLSDNKSMLQILKWNNKLYIVLHESHNCGVSRVLLPRGMAFQKLPFGLKVPLNVESLTSKTEKRYSASYVFSPILSIVIFFSMPIHFLKFFIYNRANLRFICQYYYLHSIIHMYILLIHAGA